MSRIDGVILEQQVFERRGALPPVYRILNKQGNTGQVIVYGI